MIKVGVVGGTGYTGVELLRLLAVHPEVQLQAVTSRGEAGTLVSDLYPNLRGYVDIAFSEPDTGVLAACDLVFFATPNGIAMKMARDLLESGVRLIDLAADFRLHDAAVWQQWYGMEHACPDLLAEAGVACGGEGGGAARHREEGGVGVGSAAGGVTLQATAIDSDMPIHSSRTSLAAFIAYPNFRRLNMSST